MFHTTLMRITLWFYDVDIKTKNNNRQYQ